MAFDPKNLMYVTKSYENEVKTKVETLMASNTTKNYLEKVNTELDTILKEMSDKLDVFEDVISGPNGVDTYSKQIQTSIDSDTVDVADLLDDGINNTKSHPSARAIKADRSATVYRDLNFINKNIELSSFADVSSINEYPSDTDTVKEFKINLTDNEYIKVIDFVFGYKQHPTIVDISGGEVISTEKTVTVNRYITGKFFIIRTDIDNNPQSLIVKALIKNSDNTGNVIDEKIIDVKSSNIDGKTVYTSDVGPEFELYFKIPSRTELDICIGKIIPYRWLIRKTYVKNNKIQESYISVINTGITSTISKVLYSKNMNKFFLIDDTNNKVYYTSDIKFSANNLTEFTGVDYSTSFWVKDVGSYTFIGNGTTTSVGLNNIEGLKDLVGNYINPTALVTNEILIQKDNTEIRYFNTSTVEIGDVFGTYHVSADGVVANKATFLEIENSCVLMISTDTSGNIYYKIRKPTLNSTYASSTFISTEQIVNLNSVEALAAVSCDISVNNTTSGLTVLTNYVGNASKKSFVFIFSNRTESDTDTKLITYTIKELTKFDVKLQTSEALSDYIEKIIDTSIMTFGITDTNKLLVVDKNYIVDAVRFDEVFKDVTTTDEKGIETTTSVSQGFTDKYSVINLNTDESTDEYFKTNTSYLQNIFDIYESSSGIFIADKNTGIYELCSDKQVKELHYDTGTIVSICNNSSNAINSGFILINDAHLGLCVYQHDFTVVQTPETSLRYLYLDLMNGKYVKYTTDEIMLASDSDEALNGPTVKFSADLFITLIDRTGSIYIVYQNADSNISYNETTTFADYNPNTVHNVNFSVNSIQTQLALVIRKFDIKPNKYGFINYQGFVSTDDMTASDINDDKNLVMIHKADDTSLTFDDYRKQTLRMLKDEGTNRTDNLVEYSREYKPDWDKLKYIPQRVLTDVPYTPTTTSVSNITFGDSLGAYLIYSLNNIQVKAELPNTESLSRYTLLTGATNISLMKYTGGYYYIVDKTAAANSVVYMFTYNDLIGSINGTVVLSTANVLTITGYAYASHGAILDITALDDDLETVIVSCEKAIIVYRCREIVNGTFTKPFSETARVRIMLREDLNAIGATVTGNLDSHYVGSDGNVYVFGINNHDSSLNTTINKYTDGGVWKLPATDTDKLVSVISTSTLFYVDDIIEIDDKLFFLMNTTYINSTTIPASQKALLIEYDLIAKTYVYHTELTTTGTVAAKFYKMPDGSIYIVGDKITYKYNTTTKIFVKLFDYRIGTNIVIDNNMIWTYLPETGFNTSNPNDDLDFLCYYDTTRDERKPVYINFPGNLRAVKQVKTTPYGLMVVFKTDAAYPYVYRINENDNTDENTVIPYTKSDSGILKTAFSSKGVENNNNFKIVNDSNSIDRVYRNNLLFGTFNDTLGTNVASKKYVHVANTSGTADLNTTYYKLTGGLFSPIFNVATGTIFSGNYKVFTRVNKTTVAYNIVDQTIYINPVPTETYYTYNQLTTAYTAVTGLKSWTEDTVYYMRDSYYKEIDYTVASVAGTTYYECKEPTYELAFSAIVAGTQNLPDNSGTITTAADGSTITKNASGETTATTPAPDRSFIAETDYCTATDGTAVDTIESSYFAYIPEMDKLIMNMKSVFTPTSGTASTTYFSVMFDCVKGTITKMLHPVYKAFYTTKGLFFLFSKTNGSTATSLGLGRFNAAGTLEYVEEFTSAISAVTDVTIKETSKGIFLSHAGEAKVYVYDNSLNYFNTAVLSTATFAEIIEVNGEIYAAKKGSTNLVIYKYNTTTNVFDIMFDSSDSHPFTFGGFGTIYNADTDMYNLYVFGYGDYNVYQLNETSFIPILKQFNRYNSRFDIVLDTDDDNNKIYFASSITTDNHNIYYINSKNELNTILSRVNFSRNNAILEKPVWLNDNTYKDTLVFGTYMYSSCEAQTDFIQRSLSGVYISDKIIDKTTFNDFVQNSSPTTGYCMRIVNYKGLWVAASRSTLNGVYISGDGYNWRTTNLTSACFTLYADDDIIIAGTSGPGSNGIYYSVDGLVFNKTNITTGEFPYSMGKANGKYYAGVENGLLYTSNDGRYWTASTTSGYWRKIVYFNNMYVAILENGSIMTSVDMKTWTNVNTATVGETIGVPRLSEFKNMLIGVGTSIKYSLDGTTWNATNITSGAYVCVCATDSIAVAGGTSNALCYSTDGITWTTITNTFGIIRQIWHYKKNFIMQTTTGIKHSRDGITWTATNMTTALNDTHDSGCAYDDKYIVNSWNNQFAWNSDKKDYSYKGYNSAPIDKQHVLPISINNGKDLMYANSFADPTTLDPINSTGFTLYDKSGTTVLHTDASFKYIKDTTYGIFGVLSTGEIYLNKYYTDVKSSFNLVGTGRSGADFIKIIESSKYGIFYIDDKNVMKLDTGTVELVSMTNTITVDDTITFAECFDEALMIASNNARLYATTLHPFGLNVFDIDTQKFVDIIDPTTQSGRYITGISETSKGIFIVTNELSTTVANSVLAINSAITALTNVIYRVWKNTSGSYTYEACAYNTVNPISSSYAATHPVDMSQVVELDNGSIILCRPTVFRNQASGAIGAAVGANDKTNYECSHWIYKLIDANSDTDDINQYGTYYRFEMNYETDAQYSKSYIANTSSFGDCCFSVKKTKFGDFGVRDEHCFDYQAINGTPTIPYSRKGYLASTVTYNSVARWCPPTQQICTVHGDNYTVGGKQWVNYRMIGGPFTLEISTKDKLIESNGCLYLLNTGASTVTSGTANNINLDVYKYNQYTKTFELNLHSNCYNRKLQNYVFNQVNGSTLTAYDTDYNYDNLLGKADLLDFNGVLFLLYNDQLYRYGPNLKISKETLAKDNTNRKVLYEAKITIDKSKTHFNNLNEDTSNTLLDKFVIREVGIIDTDNIVVDSSTKDVSVTSYDNNKITQYFDPHNYYNYWNGYTSKVDNDGQPLKEEYYVNTFKDLVKHTYNGFSEKNLINSRYIVKDQTVVADTMKHSVSSVFGDIEDYIKNINNAAYRLDIKIYPAYTEDKSETIPTTLEKFNG